MAQRSKKNPQNNAKPVQGPNKAAKAFIIVTLVLLVLVILFCTALIIVNSYLNKIDRVDGNVDVISPDDVVLEKDPVDSSGVTTADPNVEVKQEDEIEWWESENLDDDHLINIMLVGQDSRTGGRERSDAMILCSINPDTGEVALISFLRDLYIQMPEGYSNNRMNAAYYIGGFEFLYDVMQTNFGITCDGGIEVNFDGFKDVVDAVGGIDIELTYDESCIVGTYTEGWNHLNGEEALAYSRIRNLDSDFGRTDRQRAVMQAILDSVRNLGVTDLLSLVDTLIPMVTTDMTNSQIIDLAMVAIPMLKDLEMQSYRIPTDDAYYLAMIDEMSVLVPDLELCQYYLKEEFLPLS